MTSPRIRVFLCALLGVGAVQLALGALGATRTQTRRAPPPVRVEQAIRAAQTCALQAERAGFRIAQRRYAGVATALGAPEGVVRSVERVEGGAITNFDVRAQDATVGILREGLITRAEAVVVGLPRATRGHGGRCTR